MNDRTRVLLQLLSFLLLACSAFMSHMAYFSGDPSGLQYLFLDWAKWPAIFACIVLIPQLWWINENWWNLLLAVACYMVADLQRLRWAGYTRDVIDRVGALLAVVLLAIALVLLIMRWRHLISISK